MPKERDICQVFGQEGFSDLHEIVHVARFRDRTSQRYVYLDRDRLPGCIHVYVHPELEDPNISGTQVVGKNLVGGRMGAVQFEPDQISKTDASRPNRVPLRQGCCGRQPGRARRTVALGARTSSIVESPSSRTSLACRMILSRWGGRRASGVGAKGAGIKTETGCYTFRHRISLYKLSPVSSFCCNSGQRFNPWRTQERRKGRGVHPPPFIVLAARRS